MVDLFFFFFTINDLMKRHEPLKCFTGQTFGQIIEKHIFISINISQEKYF